MLDCLAALVVLIPPVMLGYWVVLRLPVEAIPVRWRFLLAAGIGLGATSLMVLALGLIGFLSRPLWLFILGFFVLLGLASFRGVTLPPPAETCNAPAGHPTRWVYASLLMVPFLVLAMRNASNAPGFIWAEEGFGYDVLEYHLQVPKEYLQNGRIAYLPHNVYANFPSNVEMLYLLAMIVHGGTSDIGTIANTIHLLLGVLFILALWLIGCEWSRGVGLVTAFAGGSVGWIPYLSGLAYVELGMLFFGALALAALLRAFSKFNPPHNPRFWVALSGLFAGLACGCKYPAVVMIAFPLFIVLFIVSSSAWSVRLRHGLTFLLTCVAVFSPWLLRNLVWTGNPVFPLANSMFHAAPPGWGSDEDARWVRGHSPSEQEGSSTARARILWSRTIGDSLGRFGLIILLLPILLCVSRTMDRLQVSMALFLVVQLLVWTFATHLFTRFAVPILLPLCTMLSSSVSQMRSRAEGVAVVAVLTLGAALNLVDAASLSRTEALTAASESLFSSGQVPGYEYLGALNRDLSPKARLLLVGDAKPYYIDRKVDYCVVFNRNPFLEAVRVAKEPVEVMQWLHQKGYTHIVIHWGEVERLRNTYGFAVEITPVLFEQLQRSGLILVQSFPHPRHQGKYIDLFSVPADYSR